MNARGDRPRRNPALQILRVLVSEQKNYGLYGDIEELYERRLAASGRMRAGAWLWRQVARTMVHALFNSLFWSGVLFRNSLKITWRNFQRQKLYTLINIVGLATGMACFILIMTYVHYELGYDAFHQKADRIYRLTVRGNLSQQPLNLASSNGAIAPGLAREIPEIESFVRLRRRYRTAVEYRENVFFEEGILWADASVFDVFSFRLVQGDPSSALKAPFTAVLTRETARRYFGRDDPVGKVLKINHSLDYTVTGVVEEPPDDSHLRFDMLFSFITYENANPRSFSRWMGDFDNHSFLLLKKGADPGVVEQKCLPLIDKEIGPIIKSVGGKMAFRLQPLPSIHLHSRLDGEISANSDVATVSLYAAIGFFILLLACINFMNLAVARSSKRALEVGIRKVHGAVRSRLVEQFLGESFIQSVIALTFGVILVQLSLPLFRSLVRVNLSHPFVEVPWLPPALMGLALIVGLAAGGYPAFILSAYRPAAVLKSSAFGGRLKSRFRTVLVVFQFAVSVLLLIMTGVIIRQIGFMKNKDLGYERERVAVVRLDNPVARQSAESIKQEFLRLPGVVSAGGASHAPAGGARHNVCQPEGFKLAESPLMGILSVDYDFLNTIEIPVLQGRGFSAGFPGDVGKAVLLNETAVRRFGWDNPIGKSIRELDDKAIQKTVVGVVRDFHFTDVRTAIEPMMIDLKPGEIGSLAVRFAAGGMAGRMAELMRIWKGATGGIPFDAYVLEDDLALGFRAEERLARLFVSFSVLAVFIACLGLVGMSAQAAEQRTKEVGIRKILGASTSRLVIILNWDVGKLILVANLIAWPLAFFWAERWLRAFSYRTSVPLWLFAAAAGLVLAVGFLTTSYHSMRAASADPVRSLRYE